MVGSPYQTTENLAEDLQFIHDLQPEMIGIGPFIPHADTPFRDFPGGYCGTDPLFNPYSPAHAAGCTDSVHNRPRNHSSPGPGNGILSGANVVMPNLSPVRVREKYLLYDHKICTGEEAAECRDCLNHRLEAIGYHIVTDRGDFIPTKKGEENHV